MHRSDSDTAATSSSCSEVARTVTQRRRTSHLGDACGGDLGHWRRRDGEPRAGPVKENEGEDPDRNLRGALGRFGSSLWLGRRRIGLRRHLRQRHGRRQHRRRRIRRHVGRLRWRRGRGRHLGQRWFGDGWCFGQRWFGNGWCFGQRWFKRRLRRRDRRLRRRDRRHRRRQQQELHGHREGLQHVPDGRCLQAAGGVQGPDAWLQRHAESVQLVLHRAGVQGRRLHLVRGHPELWGHADALLELQQLEHRLHRARLHLDAGLRWHRQRVRNVQQPDRV